MVDAPNEGTPGDVLNSRMTEAVNMAAEAKKQQTRWHYLAIGLSLGGSIGAALAGAAVASSNSLTGGWRTTVVVVAFVGAGLSGAAAGIRAPEREETKRRKKAQLDALARRLDTVIKLDLDKLDPTSRRQRVEAALNYLDEIDGVSSPEGFEPPGETSSKIAAPKQDDSPSEETAVTTPNNSPAEGAESKSDDPSTRLFGNVSFETSRDREDGQ